MWVKIDDGMPEHRKVFAAASALGGPHCYARILSMLLQGTCYGARNLTDGFLPFEVAKRFHDANPIVAAKALVSANLWEMADGGFQVHDYGAYNPLASTVKEKRLKDSERKKRGFQLEDREDSARNPESTRERDGTGNGKVPTGESEGDSPVPALIAHYHDGYLRRFGEKPHISGEKDGATLKRLARTHSAERVKLRIDALLDTKDEFIIGAGRTIGLLSTCWNKLGGPLKSSVLGARSGACRHTPHCLDDAACTKRNIEDMKKGAA